MENNLEFCDNCPRMCKCNKQTSVGFCGVSNNISISKIMLHYWEEPCISGKNGSGAIFFSGCNLKCVYCQNHEISCSVSGKNYSVNDLINIFKHFESVGAENINLVTPTPYLNQIYEALKTYKPAIPVVYNCSGYENYESLKKLNGLIDVYLVDCKYFSSELSKKYSNAKNYFDEFCKAIYEMKKQQPVLNFSENGLLKNGVIIRHLILPNCTNDSIKIAKWLNEHIDNNTIISLMSQFTPCHKANEFAELNRELKPLEYKRVINYYKSNTKFENVYIQDLSSANESFIPDFKC